MNIDGLQLLAVVIGSGGIGAAFSAWLNYKSTTTKTTAEEKLSWYDRAINEIERLEARLDKAEQKLAEAEIEYEEKEEELEEEIKNLEKRLCTEADLRRQKERMLQKELERNKELKETIEGLKKIVQEIRKELEDAQRKGGE